MFLVTSSSILFKGKSFTITNPVALILNFFFRYSWFRLLLIIPEIILSSALSIIVENWAVCTMWFGDWYDFYIVEKEVDDDDGNNNDDRIKNLKRHSPLLMV